MLQRVRVNIFTLYRNDRKPAEWVSHRYSFNTVVFQLFSHIYYVRVSFNGRTGNRPNYLSEPLFILRVTDGFSG